MSAADAVIGRDEGAFEVHSKQAVFDMEKRAFYKVLLELLDEFEYDFDVLAALLRLPVSRLKKAFLELYAYYHRPR